VFSPKPLKNLAQIRLVVFEKNAKIHTLIPKNDVTESKVRGLGYSDNQLKAVNKFKDRFRFSKTMLSGSLKLTFNITI